MCLVFKLLMNNNPNATKYIMSICIPTLIMLQLVSAGVIFNNLEKSKVHMCKIINTTNLNVTLFLLIMFCFICVIQFVDEQQQS